MAEAMMGAKREFESPLLRRRRDPLNQLHFGVPAPDPERERLRERLDAALHSTCAALPRPLRAEAAALLDGYGAGRVSFIGLFYTPTWSFLADPSLPDDQRELAERAQAHALFIHLWDDHLCDGQLAPDLVRLHLRSLAWQRFEASARALARIRGRGDDFVDAQVERYFEAVHSAGRNVGDLDDYLDRARDEIAIWTLVPAMIGAAQGPGLAAAVEHFSVAWRLLDDLQDTHDDLLADHRSAVWWACDPPLRAAWAACRLRSDGRVRTGQAEPQRYADLLAALAAAGIIDDLLGRARASLELAGNAATSANHHNLATDVLTMRLGLAEYPSPERVDMLGA